MTLTEFLLARIAEDEAMAREALAATSIYDQPTVKWHWLVAHSKGSTWHPTPADPTRVLAECEAKRQIVADWQYEYDRDQKSAIYPPHLPNAVEGALFGVMRHLALPYANHKEDYQEEWRI